MSVVNLPRDDLGLQRLGEANAARFVTMVAPLAAGVSVGSQTSPIPATPMPSPEERRHGERRRKRERRGRPQSTLLDTRSHHERRTQERRRHMGEQTGNIPIGIDIYI